MFSLCLTTFDNDIDTVFKGEWFLCMWCGQCQKAIEKQLHAYNFSYIYADRLTLPVWDVYLGNYLKKCWHTVGTAVYNIRAEKWYSTEQIHLCVYNDCQIFFLFFFFIINCLQPNFYIRWYLKETSFENSMNERDRK